MEQHHADVHAAIAGRHDPRPQPVKESLVEPGDVELRPTVRRRSRAGAFEGQRIEPQDRRVRPDPGGTLEDPKTDEVVIVLADEIKKLGEVECGRREAGPGILDRPPSVGPGQIDRTARIVGEVARIVRMDPQRPGK